MNHPVTLLHCSSQVEKKSHIRVILDVDGFQALGTGDADTIEDASIAAVNDAFTSLATINGALIQSAPQFVDSVLMHNTNGRRYNLVMAFGEGEGHVQGVAEGMMPEPDLYVLAYLDLLSNRNGSCPTVISREEQEVKARPLWE